VLASLAVLTSSSQVKKKDAQKKVKRKMVGEGHKEIIII
jgi:hypothetical protein